jgi:hypothetical protein
VVLAGAGEVLAPLTRGRHVPAGSIPGNAA